MSAAHTCSAQTTERCPACGHKDTRDAFECWAREPNGATHFAAICPKCESSHPDQSDHDDPPCDACYENELAEDRA